MRRTEEAGIKSRVESVTAWVFFDQELIQYDYTHLVLLPTLQKRLRFRRFKSDRDEIWQDFFPSK